MENGYSFFAMLSRMKLIDRWALMRNSRKENLSEHTLETAIISHALVGIACDVFGKNLDADRAAVIALFHDAPEIITGDMPTPVKYHNEEVRKAYQTVEDYACEEMLDMLPENLRDRYKPFFFKQESDAELWKYVKAADKLSALIKCIEEKKTGNTEFDNAAQSSRRALDEMGMEEVKYFIETFLEGYELTLDELKK